MLPKIEKARQYRASLALEAQSLVPAVPGDSVRIYLCLFFSSHLSFLLSYRKNVIYLNRHW